LPEEWQASTLSSVFTLYQETAEFRNGELKSFMGGGKTAIAGEVVNIMSLVTSLTPFVEMFIQLNESIKTYVLPGFDASVSIVLFGLGLKQFIDATEEKDEAVRRQQYKAAAANVGAALLSFSSAILSIGNVGTIAAACGVLGLILWSLGESFQSVVAEEGWTFVGGVTKAGFAFILGLLKILDALKFQVQILMALAASGAGVGAGITAGRHGAELRNDESSDASRSDIESGKVENYGTFNRS
jgi:hypothetical protein